MGSHKKIKHICQKEGLFLFYLFSLNLLFINISYAQTSPGGISTGISAWYKGDVGLTAAIWNDQTVNGFNLTGINSPTTTNIINFNPVATFNGTDQAYSNSAIKTGWPVGSTANTYYYVAKPASLVFSKSALKFGSGGSSSLMYTGLGFRSSISNGGQDNFQSGDKAILPDSPGNMTWYSNNLLRLVRTGYSGTSRYISTQNQAEVSGTAYTSTTLDNAPFNVGVGQWTGDIAEVIVYSGKHTAAQYNKVESYLAIKYGFTRNTDYISSNGTTIWNPTTNAGFNTNIAGIGRDDASGLSQLMATSQDLFEIVTLYNSAYSLATLPTLNTSGTAIGTDQSFLMWGHNKKQPAYIKPYIPTTFSPGSLFNRMDRVYKTQLTGTLGTITVQGPTDAEYLLIADDASFTTNVQEIMITPGTGVLSTAMLTNGKFFSFGKRINNMDSDNDGVYDFVDLDDDNDGILDSLELDQSSELIANGDGCSLAEWDVTGNVNIRTYPTGACDFRFAEGTLIPNGAMSQSFVGLLPGNNYIWNISVYKAGLQNGTLALKYEVFEGTDIIATAISYNNDSGSVITYPVNFTPSFSNITIRITDISISIDSNEMNVNNTSIIGIGASAGESTVGLDFDSDLIYNHLDLDSDNDGIYDLVESGADALSLDPDGNGIIDGAQFLDLNINGLADAIEAINGTDTGTIPTQTTTGTSNMLNLDSDADGCSDATEAYSDFNADGGDGGIYNPANTNTEPYTLGAGIDAYGRVTEAAYTAPKDFDASINPDYIEAAFSFCFCNDPSDPDTDGDGIRNNCDLDDDNDGLLDADEGCGTLILDGLTANKAFTDLGMASNVSMSGVYFFNIGGQTFSSYVDAHGYVLIAIEFGGEPAGNLKQSTNLTNTASGILNPTILGNLTNINKLRITHSENLLDVKTTNTTLISRVINNQTLSQGSMDNALNDTWEGINSIYITRDAIGNISTSNLDGAILVVNGNGSGMHWWPNRNDTRLIYNDGEIPSNESFNLWVLAPPIKYTDTDEDGIIDCLDLDSDNDGIYDLIESGANPSLDTNLDGIIDTMDAPATGDTDNDGLADIIETSNGANTGTIPRETTAGRPDYISLNSDADGCSDAAEAYSDFDADGGDGGIYNPANATIEPYTLGAGIDANGRVTAAVYAPPADFNGNVTQDYIEAGFSFCFCNDPSDPDTDGDGIRNKCDLDDDNDGILDTLEDLCTTFVEILPVDLGFIGSGPFVTARFEISELLGYPLGSVILNINKVNVKSLLWSVDSGISSGFRFSGTVPVKIQLIHGSQIAGPVGVQEGIRTFDGYPYTFAGALNPGFSDTIFGNEYYVERDAAATSDNAGTLQWNSVEYSTDVEFWTNSSILNEIIKVLVCPATDTDLDGIPDHLDLDSDGDGCTDADEAYGNTNADGGDTGFFGTDTPTLANGMVDANGLVISAGVTGSVYNIIPTTTTGGKNTFQEAVQLTIETPPVAQSVCSGSSATFSVSAMAETADTYTAGTPNYINLDNDAGANISYQWYLGNPATTGTPIAAADTNYTGEDTAALSIADVTGLDASVYYVVITHNDNMCIEEMANVTLTVKPKPLILDKTATICSNVALNFDLDALVPGVGDTYSYTVTSSNAITSPPGINRIVASTTNITDTYTNTTTADITIIYSVSPKGANGCVGNPFDIVVTVSPEVLPPTTVPVIYCINDTAVALNTSVTPAGSTLVWYSDALGVTKIAEPTVNTSVASSSTSYWVGRTVNGCKSVLTEITVKVNTLPSIPTVASTTQPTCALPTGTITFTAQAGVEYSLGGAFQTSETFSGLAPNTYTPTVRSTTDATCTSGAVSTVTINSVPTAPSIPTVASTTQPTCALPTGTITFTAQAGVEYSLGGAFQTSETFSGLAPNTYTPTVRSTTDATCTSGAVSTVTINSVPTAPSIPTVASTTQPTCALPTGTITFTAQAGVEYSLGGAFQTSETFSGLAPNTYTPTVRSTTDATCTSGAVSTVTINSVPTALTTPIATNVVYCGNDTVTALSTNVIASGTLIWYSDASGTIVISEPKVDTSVASGPTSYWVSQIDTTSACESALAEITVTVILPVLNLDPNYTLCTNLIVGGDMVSQPIIDTGLSDLDYSFIWTKDNTLDSGGTIVGSDSSSYAPTQSGSYYVEIALVDGPGCRVTSNEIMVFDSLPPSLTASVLTAAFASNHGIEVKAENITASNGISAYEFSLNNGPWELGTNAPGDIYTYTFLDNVKLGINIIKGRDVNGCGESEINIMVMDYPLYFTPNGDGNHETWNISGTENPKNYLASAQIYIFDRYGKLLKQLNPTGSGWDGTYKGHAMPTNDYWFLVDYVDPLDDSQKQFKAHFTLKR